MREKGKIQYGRKLTTDITTEGTALVNAIRAQAKKLGIDDVGISDEPIPEA